MNAFVSISYPCLIEKYIFKIFIMYVHVHKLIVFGSQLHVYVHIKTIIS